MHTCNIFVAISYILFYIHNILHNNVIFYSHSLCTMHTIINSLEKLIIQYLKKKS